MKTRIKILAPVLAIGVAILIAADANACSGSPRPPCQQSVWLAKFVPKNVVNPGPLTPIDIPIGLIPFAAWDAGNPGTCAQPVSATLEITIECTPAGGGAAVQLGPFPVPVDTPVSPGAQAVNGALGGPATITIPAGQIPAGSFVCTVVGTYTVVFGSGTGAGAVSGTGDTGLCIVEAAPGFPDLPRLEFCRIDMGDNGFARCARGDQSINYYFIANNDPGHAVTVDFSSDTNQVAVMPSGDNDDNTFFAFAGFDADSGLTKPDPFYQAFADDLMGGIIPDTMPDPGTTGQVGREFSINPLDSMIVAIANRSLGMCSDGSCVEIRADVTGTWANGDIAVGCAGSATIVGPLPFKTPLFEIQDLVKTDPLTDAIWRYAEFDETPFMSTHSAGRNLEVNPGFTQTTGEAIGMVFDVMGFPPMAVDTLRSIEPLDSVRYYFYGFRIDNPGMPNGLNYNVDIAITGLANQPEVAMPLILSPDPEFTFFPFSSLQVNYNAQTDAITVVSALTSGEDLSYTGTLGDLIKGADPRFEVIPSVCRQFTRMEPHTPSTLTADPLGVTALINRNGANPTIPIDILDGLTWDPIGWTSAVAVNGVVSPLPLSSVPGPPLGLGISASDVPLAPETYHTFVTVQNPATFNMELRVPVALRGFDGGPVDAFDPGSDPFTAPYCGIGTELDFTMLPPIPADFFGPGSLPFEGVVKLTGEPLGDPALGLADTIIRRTEGAAVPEPGNSDTVPIEIVALNLVSCEPIVVQFSGGVDSFFDVFVTLAPDAVTGGMMMLERTSERGGTASVDSFFDIQVRLVEVGNPTNEFIYSGADKGLGLQFSAENIPWADGCDNSNLVRIQSPLNLNGTVVPPSTQGFYLGVAPDGLDDSQDCAIAYTQLNGGGISTGLIPAVMALEFGDMNFDGETDAVDIQLVINGALGLLTPFPTDVNGDGETDAVDVQTIINIVLGLFS